MITTPPPGPECQGQGHELSLLKFTSITNLNHLCQPPSESGNLTQGQNPEVCLLDLPEGNTDFPNKINHLLSIWSSVSNLLLKMFQWWHSAEDDCQPPLSHEVYMGSSMTQSLPSTWLAPRILPALTAQIVFPSQQSYIFIGIKWNLFHNELWILHNEKIMASRKG